MEYQVLGPTFAYGLIGFIFVCGLAMVITAVWGVISRLKHERKDTSSFLRGRC